MSRRRKVAPHGKYAQIPLGVAKAVLASLSAPEFRVWFALCMQCQHWSNGTGKLCRSVIREFHLGSQRVVTAATKRLIADKHIVMTRRPIQRKCALYGVAHLPLNTDAMSKEGLNEAEIRTALKLFGDAASDTNRGSANSATKAEAQNDEIDNRGSANPPEQALALPKSRGFAPKSTSLALPQGNTSKNLPSASAFLGSASSSASDSAHPSLAPVHESIAVDDRLLDRVEKVFAEHSLRGVDIDTNSPGIVSHLCKLTLCTEQQVTGAIKHLTNAGRLPIKGRSQVASARA